MMTNHHFKIRTTFRSLLGLYISCVIIILMLIVPTVLLEIPVGAQMFSYIFCFLMLVAMVTTTLLCFSVDGTDIKVRTWYGKRYQVSCSKIKKIFCNQTQSTKQGIRYSITITTEHHEFTVDGRLNGFSAFACYLLDMLETGEIKSSAASESCRKTLRRYQKEFQPKE